MPKTVLGVVARVQARPGSVEIVREGLRGLLEPTRNEVGCISYELMQNESDPSDFTFYEEWTDAAALDAHGLTPHIRSTFRQLDGHLAAAPDVRRYSYIDL